MKLSVRIMPVLAAILAAGCASVQERHAFLQYNEAGKSLFGELKPGLSTAVAPQIDEKATIDDYVAYAFLNNPGLKAAFKRWKAALERAPQARSLDDPAFTYEHSLNEVDFLYRFSVSQMIPGFGKLDLRARRAVAEADAAMHEFEAAKLMLFSEVIEAFHEYCYLERTTAITEENVQLLVDLESVVRTKYEAGSAQFSELTKVQVEMDSMKNELATLKDERTARSAALASMLNLPREEALPWPRVTPSAQAIISDKVLFNMLRDLNPELKALDAMVVRDTYSEQLAKKSRYPDFMLGAGMMFFSDMDGSDEESETGIMAGITIPIWQGKYAAEIREASAMLETTVGERDDKENELKAELRMAIFKSRDAERRIGLFRDSLIPKAKQAFEVARQDFSGGKTDFMTLIDAQRTLLEFRLMYERAVADREIALAEIGRFIGKYGIALKEE